MLDFFVCSASASSSSNASTRSNAFPVSEYSLNIGNMLPSSSFTCAWAKSENLIELLYQSFMEEVHIDPPYLTALILAVNLETWCRNDEHLLKEPDSHFSSFPAKSIKRKRKKSKLITITRYYPKEILCHKCNDSLAQQCKKKLQLNSSEIITNWHLML